MCQDLRYKKRMPETIATAAKTTTVVTGVRIAGDLTSYSERRLPRTQSNVTKYRSWAGSRRRYHFFRCRPLAVFHHCRLSAGSTTPDLLVCHSDFRQQFSGFRPLVLSMYRIFSDYDNVNRFRWIELGELFDQFLRRSYNCGMRMGDPFYLHVMPNSHYPQQGFCTGSTHNPFNGPLPAVSFLPFIWSPAGIAAVALYSPFPCAAREALPPTSPKGQSACHLPREAPQGIAATHMAGIPGRLARTPPVGHMSGP